jgi:hypothetical protein
VHREKGRNLSARNYVSGLAASGRYHFTSREARSALGVSAAAAKLALNRLAKQKAIASPARSFYVVIPPEYQSLGCLPADQFIPEKLAAVAKTAPIPWAQRLGYLLEHVGFRAKV